MPLPRGDEYLAAVQNPRTAFNDTDLKICQAETDKFGIPKPFAGGFTTTFHLLNHNKEWAARCFTRSVPDLQRRYDCLGVFLQNNPNDYFVSASCLNQGIRIGQYWHPIIKMDWMAGDTLNSSIEQNIGNPAKIKNIINEFVRMVNALNVLGVAHGDLQHGNIIVVGGKLKLIDYDGIFLPSLSNLKSNEIGHINYQHPLRNENYFNANIDRFASIVIYIGLQAISLAPNLWNKYDNSENILFKADDFVNVETSPLLHEISLIQPLKQFVERFRGVCKLEIDKVPNLTQFIEGNFSYPKVVPSKNYIPTHITVNRSQYPILDGSIKTILMRHIGQRVEVVGRISGKYKGYTYRNDPFLFLNIGIYPLQTFTLVLWSNNLDIFRSAGIDPQNYVGKLIKISGVLGSYNGNPQMVVERPSQIQILSNELEARKLLGNIKNHSKLETPYENNVLSPDRIFNELYKNRTTAPNSKIRLVNANSNRTKFQNTGGKSNQPVYKYTPPSNKKSTNTPLGIVGSIILGCLGAVTLGWLGVIIGGVLGFLLGKRL